jgi:hypothetical protein
MGSIPQPKPTYTKSYFDKKSNKKSVGNYITDHTLAKSMGQEISPKSVNQQILNIKPEQRGEVINYNIQEITPTEKETKVSWWKKIWGSI